MKRQRPLRKLFTHAITDDRQPNDHRVCCRRHGPDFSVEAQLRCMHMRRLHYAIQLGKL